MSISSELSSQSSRISSNSNADHGQPESFDSSEELGSISHLKVVLGKRNRNRSSSIDSKENKRIIANFNNTSDDTLKAGDYHEYDEIYINKCITCNQLYNKYKNQDAQINDFHEYNPDNSRSSNSRQKKKKRTSRSSSSSGGTKRTKRRRKSKRKSKRRNT